MHNAGVQESARQVDALLQRYLKIHDDVFRLPFKKIVPISFLFKPRDYRSHYENLYLILEELAEIIGSLRAATERNDQYAIALKAYAEALVESVLILRAICGSLHDKNNDNLMPYNKSHYAFDLKQYRLATRKHRDLAKPLRAHSPSFPALKLKAKTK